MENKWKLKMRRKKNSMPVKRLSQNPYRSRGINPNHSFRVKVSGLPRFYSPTDPLLTEFKKMLREELELNFNYIRSPKKGNSWLYITFTKQEDQERALTLLRRYTWKNRTIICTLVVADVLKRKGEDSNEGTESKKPKLDIPLEEQMLMSTIPYHSIAYEEQLSKKNEEAACHLKWLFELIQKRSYPLSGWIEEQITKLGKGVPFTLEEIKPSPTVDGYRNRCEFRVGINPQNQEVTVGYRVDNQDERSVWVAPPDSLRHLPKQMIEVVKAFETFIKKSPYPPVLTQNNSEDKGIWRMLLLRINKKGDIMMVVVIRPPENETLNTEDIKKSIVEYFADGDGKDLNVKSMYLHLDKDRNNAIFGERRESSGIEHFWGSEHLDENILNLNLDVTPNFYFHWNTYGAEQLYNAVIDLAAVDSETTVLDLCCGSGGMGLTLAKLCKEVVGVELMDVNVEDAKKIAVKNELTNCEFLQGKIDDLYPQILEKLQGKKVIPILDPPRNGISQKMIVNLRNLKEADKIIYVCSNHKLPLKNLLDLGSVESGSFGETNPFIPTRIIPIDMSPHALRCELVILCERIDMTTIPKPTRRAPDSDQRKDRRRKRFRTPRGRYSSGPRGFGNGYGVRPSRFAISARDSLYPPPLRAALYGDFPQRDMSPRFGNFNDYDNPRGRRGLLDDIDSRYDRFFDKLPPHGRDMPPGRIPSLFDAPIRPPLNFDSDLSRYSNFRRDVEDAIDSSYPQYQRGGGRFSIESTMFEREQRAFEAGLSRGLTNGANSFGFPKGRKPVKPNTRRGRGGKAGGSTWR
uniref:tRNA (uracil(54)-C(5))-methyltransferase n=1 Tax=Clastoptera arizonana TaxID=38151 RepID=A0A1B6DRV2_9HEMI